MSYNYHKTDYKKTSEKLPKSRSQMPANMISKSSNVNKDSPREGSTLSESYYPSIGSEPTLGDPKIGSRTGIDLPGIAIKDGLSPSQELGGLGL